MRPQRLRATPTTQSITRIAWAACLAGLLGPASATAQQPEHITLGSCRDSCGLSLVLEAELGDDSGPGMIDLTGVVRAYRDASKRTYIVGEPIDHILVFDPAGHFLRRVGRTGSGPGEFRDGASLVVTGDGEFSVFDRGRGVILNFDYTGRLRSEVRTVGERFPDGVETYRWEGPWVLHVTNMRTPDRAGYPLHPVNVETGEIGRSFGSSTGELELGGGWIPSIAITRDRRIWMARNPLSRYEISLWDGNRELLVFRRDARWFPERVDPLPHGPEDKPLPAIDDLVATDSLLWVSGVVADERWRDFRDNRDADGRYDEFVEVIDLRTNTVVGSQRFDFELTHFLEPGLIGRVHITESASVRFRVYRVVPEADLRR